MKWYRAVLVIREMLRCKNKLHCLHVGCLRMKAIDNRMNTLHIKDWSIIHRDDICTKKETFEGTEALDSNRWMKHMGNKCTMEAGTSIKVEAKGEIIIEIQTNSNCSSFQKGMGRYLQRW